MEYLKEALGEKYDEFNLLINKYNKSVKNSSQLIKLANLSTGDYVSKAKYTALKRKNDKLLILLDRLNKESKTSKYNSEDLFADKKTALCSMEVSIHAKYRAI